VTSRSVLAAGSRCCDHAVADRHLGSCHMAHGVLLIGVEVVERPGGDDEPEAIRDPCVS